MNWQGPDEGLVNELVDSPWVIAWEDNERREEDEMCWLEAAPSIVLNDDETSRACARCGDAPGPLLPCDRCAGAYCRACVVAWAPDGPTFVCADCMAAHMHDFTTTHFGSTDTLADNLAWLVEHGDVQEVSHG